MEAELDVLAYFATLGLSSLDSHSRALGFVLFRNLACVDILLGVTAAQTAVDVLGMDGEGEREREGDLPEDLDLEEYLCAVHMCVSMAARYAEWDTDQVAEEAVHAVRDVCEAALASVTAVLSSCQALGPLRTRLALTLVCPNLHLLPMEVGDFAVEALLQLPQPHVGSAARCMLDPVNGVTDTQGLPSRALDALRMCGDLTTGCGATPVDTPAALFARIARFIGSSESERLEPSELQAVSAVLSAGRVGEGPSETALYAAGVSDLRNYLFVSLADPLLHQEAGDTLVQALSLCGQASTDLDLAPLLVSALCLLFSDSYAACRDGVAALVTRLVRLPGIGAMFAEALRTAPAEVTGAAELAPVYDALADSMA
ncbi:hypothetical protein KIPB_002777 [Kipferlia bialata]|uniref:Uncharacterized protein n=1 Tax=Kipferlia bialata TaxID=797122 RepID=A0A9K3CQ82_9EUKA|nr:hypothetical protein KIPB_002196 [Kipferlia bialata]GIQ81477.1 hypothetical protein KIPB_002439 [Kipferlia bialata]GIQ81765.1 hypothetical protein KIPB_002777 [Kipferlia bialata]|eukprot:g2196.t1